MIIGDPHSAANDFHRVTDQAVGGVMHSERHIDIGKSWHRVFHKLIMNCALECAVCRPVLFDVPAKRSDAKCRPKTPTQLFILAKHFQTPVQSKNDDGQLSFLHLFLEPVRNLVGNIRAPDVDEVLKFIQC
jgi:hypothetical protein